MPIPCLSPCSVEEIEVLVMVGIFRGWLTLNPLAEFAGDQNTEQGSLGDLSLEEYKTSAASRYSRTIS
jgi:hypothetical protein